MNNYQDFLNTLLADLDELPVFVSENTKEFYDSYYLDAKESGLNESEILEKFESPETISSQIKLDYYLYQPKQAKKVFLGLFRNVFTRQAAISSGKFVLGIVTYLFAILFYLLNLLLKVGSIAVLGSGIYLIYSDYGLILNPQTISILATSLVALSLFMLVAILFEWMSFLLRKVNVNLLRDEFRKLKQPLKKKLKPGVVIYGIVLLISMIGVLTSPVYQDLTKIWMSIEPSEFRIVTETFDVTDINELYLDVRHTNIQIEYADVSEIEVYYELPEYFDLNYSTHDGVLRIQEVENNEIPYLEFFTRHEGTLDLIIKLPEDIQLDNIKIKSVGSNMELSIREVNLEIETSTSIINLEYTGEYNLDLQTDRGVVTVGNVTDTTYILDESNLYDIEVDGVSTVISVHQIIE